MIKSLVKIYSLKCQDNINVTSWRVLAVNSPASQSLRFPFTGTENLQEMRRYGSPQLPVTSSTDTKLGAQQTTYSVSFLHGSINGINLLSVTKGKGGTNLIISKIEYNY